MASELSTRAKAFSVEALLQDKVQKLPEPVSQVSSDCDLSNPSQRESPEVLASADVPSAEDSLKIDDVTVVLCGRELWKKFFDLGTEMIITKAGRRMFPSLKIKIFGLDPDAYYHLWLDIVSLDDKRYRYVYGNSQWMVAGPGDPPPTHNVYVHQESPAPGRTWMGQGTVSFDRLKLTNNRQPVIRGQISLHSMHKYQPRIHIQKSEDIGDSSLDVDKSLTFVFTETSFTTVTAYQNQEITYLKIKSNPFAKGFREATKNRTTLHNQIPSSGYTSKKVSFRPVINIAHSSTNDHQLLQTPFVHPVDHPQLPSLHLPHPHPNQRIWLTHPMTTKTESWVRGDASPLTSQPFPSGPWFPRYLTRPLVPQPSWLSYGHVSSSSEWDHEESWETEVVTDIS